MKALLMTKEQVEGCSCCSGFTGQLHTSVDCLENLCDGDEILEELLEQMLASCLRYTETVIEFKRELESSEVVASEEFQRISSDRGRVHDLAIQEIDIFVRTLSRSGKDTSWAQSFSGVRAYYARFAILITLSRIKEK